MILRYRINTDLYLLCPTTETSEASLLRLISSRKTYFGSVICLDSK